MQENDFHLATRNVVTLSGDGGSRGCLYTELQYQTQRLEFYFSYYALCVRHPGPPLPGLQISLVREPVSGVANAHQSAEKLISPGSGIKAGKFLRQRSFRYWDDVLFTKRRYAGCRPAFRMLRVTQCDVAEPGAGLYLFSPQQFTFSFTHA